MKSIYKFSFLLLGIFSLLAVSCQSEDIISGDVTGEQSIPEGMGGLSIRSVATVDESSIPVITTTKSFGMDVNNFIVEIRNEAGEVVKKFDSYRELKEGSQPMVILPVGKYTLRAYSSEPVNGGFDVPYFMGERSFVLLDKTVTTVENVVCKFASVAVDIRFDAFFDILFKDNYSITVDNCAGGKVTFTKDTKGKIAYFDRVGESMKMLVTVQSQKADAPYPERTYYILNGKEIPHVGEYYVIQFTGEVPSTQVAH
ncbi:MAG: DUF4493 domain-containing protein [Parabacteroides sp.]|nr:DUF4493 domain-containing protein [Parabacteroides sp.]